MHSIITFFYNVTCPQAKQRTGECIDHALFLTLFECTVWRQPFVSVLKYNTSNKSLEQWACVSSCTFYELQVRTLRSNHIAIKNSNSAIKRETRRSCLFFAFVFITNKCMLLSLSIYSYKFFRIYCRGTFRESYFRINFRLVFTEKFIAETDVFITKWQIIWTTVFKIYLIFQYFPKCKITEK